MFPALWRLAAVLSVLPLSVASPADSPFQAATAAFEQGDFQRALDLFEVARAAGADGPAVPYNIGVCHYKLGRYAEAEADFAALGARFQEMRALADYNRGLALLGLEREADASAAFVAARDGGEPAIADLAAAMLGRLDEPPPSPARTRWVGLLDAGLGHDGNVALLDELSLPAGQSADSPFFELFGYAGRSFVARLPFRVDLSAYAVHYSEASQFDQSSMRVALPFLPRYRDWSFEIGPHYEHTTLDGAGLQRELGIAAGAYRSVGAQMRFAAALVLDDVAALESQFAFLEGSQRRFGVALEPRASAPGFRVAYETEENDRAASSVTSARNRVEIGYRHAVAGWLVAGRVSHRVSRYDDAAQRREDLDELDVYARREMGRGWYLRAEYRRSDNESDVAQFSYEADRFGVTFGRTF